MAHQLNYLYFALYKYITVFSAVNNKGSKFSLLLLALQKHEEHPSRDKGEGTQRLLLVKQCTF